VQLLEQEFHYAPRVSEAILAEAEAHLVGRPGHLRPGQMRVILVRRDAGHGRPLRETAGREVIWTIDAGQEYRRLEREAGYQGVRQARLERLVEEALEQGAVATQEDLAQALHVSVRTVKRDFAELRRRGIQLSSRGPVQGIGRGQTHKGQIVRRWLRGETYDQIAQHTHHSTSSIQRYVQTFGQVVLLHRQGFQEGQIGLLVQIGPAVVREYLTLVQDEGNSPDRERLEAHLERLRKGGRPGARPKKGER
jgi:DNA-binding transcriptional regulator YhcF (GntR family)